MTHNGIINTSLIDCINTFNRSIVILLNTNKAVYSCKKNDNIIVIHYSSLYCFMS